jgi:hypothetical protein
MESTGRFLHLLSSNACSRHLPPAASVAETTALRPERRGKIMFSLVTMSVARFSRRRLALLGVAIVALSAATLKPAAADTYLSYWENKTSCDFDVKGNSGNFALVPAGKSYDFGPTPWKDPDNVVVVPSVPGCKVTLKEAKIGFAGGFPNKKCPGIDPGPYKFTVDNDGRKTEFCYCIQWGRVAYINVKIQDREVTLDHGPGTYSCGE